MAFVPSDQGFRDPIGDLSGVVDAVAVLDAAGLTDGEVAGELLRLRRQMDRLEAVYAGLVRAAVVRGTGSVDGYRSTKAWASWRTGQHPGQVARAARLGELTELLPETAAAWRDGEITSGAVEQIGRAHIAGHEDALVACEPELLLFARWHDRKALDIAVGRARAVAMADGSEPPAPDGITLSPVGDRVVVSGELSGDAAGTVARALDRFSPPPSEESSATHAQRRAEGLVTACRIALAAGERGEVSVARPSVMIVTQERVDGDVPLALGSYAGVLSPATRSRLLCDCDLTDVLVDREGIPLSVGRTTRVWPTMIRKSMIVRDRGCVWPGCTAPPEWCDAHHFVHWEDGGPTSAANGMLLCRAHHTFLHQHPDWTFTFREQWFRVFRPDGRELHPDPWHPDNVVGNAGPAPPPRAWNPQLA